MSDNIKNKKPKTLAKKMGIALSFGVIVGLIFMFLRESLLKSDYSYIWDIINNILFQDISVAEGTNSIGLFYILGQLFINSLQLVIVPLIFSSIALSMCQIKDTKKFGRIAGKTVSNFLIMYILALALACVLGLIADNLSMFKVEINGISSSEATSSSSNPLMIILDAVPNNFLSVFTTNSRVLSIVFLAIITGICINKLDDKILVIKNVLEDINNIVSEFLSFIINKFSPIAIFILISRTFAIYGIEHLKPAISYMLVTTIGCVIFFILGYPSYIYIKTKLNPFIFIKKISKVALLGVSAASSAAALSLNEKTCEEELGINKEIISFTLPLGMTVNMNGTAIMQVIATVFIASSAGYNVTFFNIILISFLALMASIGTPSIPGSSTIILFSILTAMGYNNEASLIAYSLIIAINRPMDMLVTALNVVGDAGTALIVSKSENNLNEEIYKRQIK